MSVLLVVGVFMEMDQHVEADMVAGCEDAIQDAWKAPWTTTGRDGWCKMREGRSSGHRVVLTPTALWLRVHHGSATPTSRANGAGDGDMNEAEGNHNAAGVTTSEALDDNFDWEEMVCHQEQDQR